MKINESLKILYVEDSKDNQEFIVKALNREYKNILVANDGEDGLKIFQEHNDIDLVITDIKMPKLDGLSMIEEIKKSFSDVYTILITAHNDSDYLMRGIDLKVDKYVLKPINIKELLKTVADIAQTVENKNIIIKQEKVLEEYKSVIDDFLIVSKADIDGTIKYVNDKFCQISGYTKEEIIGNKFSKVHHVLMQREKFVDMWNDILSGRTHKIIIRDKKSDGSSYWLESFISPILDDNEEIKEVISISKDITQDVKKEKEQEEQRAKEKREELTKALKVNIENLLSLIPFATFELQDGMIKNYNQEFEDIISTFCTSEIYTSLLEKKLDIKEIFDEDFEFKLFSSCDEIIPLNNSDVTYKMRYKQYENSLIVSMINVN